MRDKVCKYEIEALAGELEVDLETIVGLFSSYFAEMDEEIDEMNSLLKESDWYMLQREVHNIKGVSANLGIKDVYEAAAIFDELLKAGKTVDAASHVEKISALIEAARIEVSDFFEQHQLQL